MYIFICLIFSFLSIEINANYLNNDKVSVNYIPYPTTNLFTDKRNNIGFGCSIKKNRDIYYVSSSYQQVYYSYENYNCGRSEKYVEILKYNLDSNNFTNNLLIGQSNTEYPNAIGDLGSDNVVSCGIDNKLNILYYIASNRYNCPSNYNFDSCIVRINLDTFQFIDRTKFNDFPNLPFYTTNNYYKYRYIFNPTTSQVIDGDSVWVAFGNFYTGIWKLNITGPNVELIDNIGLVYYVERPKKIMN